MSGGSFNQLSPAFLIADLNAFVFAIKLSNDKSSWSIKLNVNSSSPETQSSGDCLVNIVYFHRTPTLEVIFLQFVQNYCCEAAAKMEASQKAAWQFAHFRPHGLSHGEFI